MATTTKLLIMLAVHITCVIIAFVARFKDESFKQAALYGDGVRFASVADLIFFCLVAPECMLLENAVDYIGGKINEKAFQHYKE